MNVIKIRGLLEQWAQLLYIGEKLARRKAETYHGGLHGRIKRTTGQPVIFDLETHENQKTIQKSLCQELPQWADLIRSQPEIMNGYPWIRSDFIDLYYEHFRLVINKLQQILDNNTEQGGQ